MSAALPVLSATVRNSSAPTRQSYRLTGAPAYSLALRLARALPDGTSIAAGRPITGGPLSVTFNYDMHASRATGLTLTLNGVDCGCAHREAAR